MNGQAETSTVRNTALDIVKAFTIILVVMGHSIQYGSGEAFLSENLYFDNRVFQMIYSFHMPLYMLISGYLFAYSLKKRTWEKNLIRKAETLLIPIALWSVIPFVLSLSDISSFSAGSLIKQYIHTAIYNLWFLWAVFLCSVLVILADRFFRDSIWIYLAGFLLTFFIPDSYNLRMYKFMYPFFLLGYFFHKYHWNNKLAEIYNKKWFRISLPVFYIFLFLFYRRDSFIYTSGYTILNKDTPLLQLGIDIYRLFIGLTGSILVLMILFQMEKYITGRVRNALMYIGKNTLGIYIISSLLFSYVLPKVTCNFTGLNYLYTIIETCLVIAICLICIKLINVSRLLNRLLFGSRG